LKAEVLVQKLKTLGARLRQYRLEAGLTQGELSRRVHYDDTTISRIEGGKLLPPEGYLPLFVETLAGSAPTPARQHGLTLAERDELAALAEGARLEWQAAQDRPRVRDNPALAAAPADLAPFVVGPPVTHPRQFYGRTHELARIFALWRHAPLQHAVVLGPRRSGKTSLLYHLKTICSAPPADLRPGQKHDWLPDPDRYRWIYIDFLNPLLRTREGVLDCLLAHLDLPRPANLTLAAFMAAVGARPLRERTLILLDEIGAAFDTPELDHEFWEMLRALGTTAGGAVGFVVAAHGPLEMLMRERGLTSPFYNIFGHTLALGPFRPDDAHALVASAPEPFADEDREWIVAHSAGWPAILQKLCDLRRNALLEGDRGDDWRAAALAALARPPYRELLEGPRA
jgi:transcriptional regulator with XRE-family HTH domain